MDIAGDRHDPGGGQSPDGVARLAGSILMTSAPQSARRAEAAGTNVCSATSRTRTPFITCVAVIACFPLSHWGSNTDSVALHLNSDIKTSMLDRARPKHHLADCLAAATRSSASLDLCQVEGGAHEGLDSTRGQQLEQLSLVSGHLIRHVGGEITERNPTMATPLSSTRLSGMRGMVPEA